MSEKIEQPVYDKEDIVYKVDTHKDHGEVGVVDAPNGGLAAWTVVFGCFCVSR
jgi:hypothetical protein